MKNILAMWLCLLAVAFTTGCKSLLPTEDRQTVNQWTNYNHSELTFDQIIPHKTTAADLKNMGIDPRSSPNVKLLSYLDVINRFIPNQSITKEDLPVDVRDCIGAKDGCQAYELNLDISHSKRYGNVVLDIFNFKRKTRITGWNFKGLIIMREGVVIYKLVSGEPNVQKVDKKVRPLGPLQELDSWVRPPRVY